MAKDRPHVASWPGDGAAPRAEALSNVYRFILECRAKRKADEPAPEPKGYNTVGESWCNPGGTPFKLARMKKGSPPASPNSNPLSPGGTY